jgi:hypothetical protein
MLTWTPDESLLQLLTYSRGALPWLPHYLHYVGSRSVDAERDELDSHKSVLRLELLGLRECSHTDPGRHGLTCDLQDVAVQVRPLTDCCGLG